MNNAWRGRIYAALFACLLLSGCNKPQFAGQSPAEPEPQPQGVGAVGHACTENEDCESRLCFDGSCRQCLSDAHCDGEYSCNAANWTCYDECRSSAQCKQGASCTLQGDCALHDVNDTGSGDDDLPWKHLESGERLKMRMAATPDGAKVFLGWYDSQREEECSFATASDGSVRCLPLVTVYAKSWTTDDFVDSDCSRPGLAAYIPDECGPGDVKYVFGRMSECHPMASPRLKVYQVAPAPEDKLYSLDSSGECRGYSTSGTFFEILGELPPSSFVQAREL